MVAERNLTSAKIPALTGFRAIAAYLVFFHHFPLPQEWTGAAFYKLTIEFHFGVTLFFVLSGFLITLRYADSAKFEGRWLGRYFRNRAARIYPLYLAVALVTLFVYKIREPWAWVNNLTLTAGFLNPREFVLPHFWSLSVEECFYFSAPVFFILMRKRPGWVTLASVAAGFWALGGLLYWAGRGDPAYGYFSEPLKFFLRTYFGHSFEFLCGMILAYRILNRGGIQARAGASRTLIGLCGVLAMAYILSLLQTEGETGLWHPLGVVVNNFFLPLFVACLMYGLIVENTWLKAVLSTKLFDVLGRASYCYYLIHIGIIPGLIVSRAPWVGTLGLFLVLNLVSILIFFCYEEPLRLRLSAPRTR